MLTATLSQKTFDRRPYGFRSKRPSSSSDYVSQAARARKRAEIASAQYFPSRVLDMAFGLSGLGA